MTTLLNLFLKSKYFNKINSFISKKIFKIFKIFFVETELKNLPDQNYKIIENDELKKAKLSGVYSSVRSVECDRKKRNF